MTNTPIVKNCKECGETLMPTDFNEDSTQSDGLSEICIECEEEKEDGKPEIVPAVVEKKLDVPPGGGLVKKFQRVQKRNKSNQNSARK